MNQSYQSKKGKAKVELSSSHSDSSDTTSSTTLPQVTRSNPSRSSSSGSSSKLPPPPPLISVVHGEMYEIFELPEDEYLHGLMAKLDKLLEEFTIDNFDVLTSSDWKRRILTQQVSFKSQLSSEKLRLRGEIESSKIEILGILQLRLNREPRFEHISEMVGSLLGSREGAQSQQVHMDYDEKHFDNIDSSLFPWSMLVPCNLHCYFGVRTAEGEQWLTIKRGQFLIFRGDLHHCGGPNPLDEPQFRIHAYGVTPNIRPPQNAIIVHPTEKYLKIPTPTVQNKSRRLGRGCKRKDND